MPSILPVRNCLVSVFNKEGLLPMISHLNTRGVKFYSTGGTEKFLSENNIPCKAVEDITGYPSILGGRVKTLHPKIFGGILARRHELEDINQISSYEIPEFDLVIVDLYPFEDTIHTPMATPQDIIDKIDIGGVSLIRATAKNHQDVCIISNRNQYASFLELFQKQNGTTLSQRKEYAIKAFIETSQYDTLIYKWLNNTLKKIPLRYGENPHQEAYFDGDLTQVFDKLQGKELSYNNLIDTDAALKLLAEFQEPTVVIVKHTNACGVASDMVLVNAWHKALSSDPQSAFGGVIAINSPIDSATATEINKLFFELLIAPAYDTEAIAILQTKTNRILLQNNPDYKPNMNQYKSIFNGTIVQQCDLQIAQAASWEVVTSLSPSDTQSVDLIYASKIVKHLKSNSIAIVKNKQLLAMGCGQTSRVDALQHAIAKAKKYMLDIRGAAMASEAFFPFSDCVTIAASSHIAAILQPGGSIKDQESIDAANMNNIVMVMTGIRHFKH